MDESDEPRHGKQIQEQKMPRPKSDHGTSETLVVGMYNRVGVQVSTGILCIITNSSSASSTFGDGSDHGSTNMVAAATWEDSRKFRSMAELQEADHIKFRSILYY